MKMEDQIPLETLENPDTGDIIDVFFTDETDITEDDVENITIDSDDEIFYVNQKVNDIRTLLKTLNRLGSKYEYVDVDISSWEDIDDIESLIESLDQLEDDDDVIDAYSNIQGLSDAKYIDTDLLNSISESILNKTQHTEFIAAGTEFISQLRNITDSQMNSGNNIDSETGSESDVDESESDESDGNKEETQRESQDSVVDDESEDGEGEDSKPENETTDDDSHATDDDGSEETEDDSEDGDDGENSNSDNSGEDGTTPDSDDDDVDKGSSDETSPEVTSDDTDVGGGEDESSESDDEQPMFTPDNPDELDASSEDTQNGESDGESEGDGDSGGDVEEPEDASSDEDVETDYATGDVDESSDSAEQDEMDFNSISQSFVDVAPDVSSDSDIAFDIGEVSVSLERIPTASDMNEHGSLDADVYTETDTDEWVGILQQVGVIPVSVDGGSEMATDGDVNSDSQPSSDGSERGISDGSGGMTVAGEENIQQGKPLGEMSEEEKEMVHEETKRQIEESEPEGFETASEAGEWDNEKGLPPHEKCDELVPDDEGSADGDDESEDGGVDGESEVSNESIDETSGEDPFTV